MKPIIEFKSVSFRYPLEESFALKDINLEVYEGEILSILGANGAGKTTLVKHMNGLLKPTYGEVFVSGKDTTKATVAELSKIVGIVFQNPDYQLFAPTVHEEIAFAMKNFGFNEFEIQRRIESILEFFSLSDYKNVSPLLLSGGEKKRVTVASVLVYDPKVLVLDEPTLGLDFKQKNNLKKIMFDMKNLGKTVILVTHDIDFASEVSDRALIMKEGRILKIGEAREIFYDEETLNEANLIAPSIARFCKALNIKSKPLNIYELMDYLLKIQNV